jgi:Golgi phosphoprotein 3
MSSAGGLSRRRVAGASTSSASDDAPSPSWTPNGSSPNGTVLTHAGSAFEGGSKVAYDPRDLDQVQEDSRYGGRMPRLTIMEEVLLLGLKDKHVCLLYFIPFLFCALFFCVPSTLSLRPPQPLILKAPRCMSRTIFMHMCPRPDISSL